LLSGADVKITYDLLYQNEGLDPGQVFFIA